MTDNNLLKAKALLTKYRQGTCSEAEKAWIEDWYLNLNTQQTDLSDQELAADLRDLQSRLPDITGERRSVRKYASIAIAASVILISGLGLYMFTIKQKELRQRSESIVIADAPAGTNKALLTLSNGRKISLTDEQRGMLASDASTEISMQQKGEIVYANSNENESQDMSINTIETPKGGQFRLVLPDGTKVQLNAASSLKYATRFTGATRTVELTGEAYFQVAHNKSMPFVVKTAAQEVKVLGTHFNVNSYLDEGKTVTTLEEGSVQVLVGKQYKMIRPGQQSLVSAKGNLLVQQADMQTALAWKNNEMVFKDAGVQEVMRQVARWYNLEIVYDGPVPDDTITASIDRQSNLSTVLRIFDTIQIHFTLMETPAGKKLIINQ